MMLFFHKINILPITDLKKKNTLVILYKFRLGFVIVNELKLSE
jgi:hypothetical protein